MSEDSNVDPSAIGGLYKKLSKVLGEVEKLPKNGYNKFNKYHYVTESDAADGIRPLLSKHGIGLKVDVLDVHEMDNARILVKMAVTMGDESGATIRSIVWGEARDADSRGQRQDKGLYKAITGGIKYWLFKTFLISSGDDPEGDQNNRPTQNKREPSQQQKPKQESANRPTKLQIARIREAKSLLTDAGEEAFFNEVMRPVEKDYRKMTAGRAIRQLREKMDDLGIEYTTSEEGKDNGSE